MGLNAQVFIKQERGRNWGSIPRWARKVWVGQHCRSPCPIRWYCLFSSHPSRRGLVRGARGGGRGSQWPSPGCIQSRWGGGWEHQHHHRYLYAHEYMINPHFYGQIKLLTLKHVLDGHGLLCDNSGYSEDLVVWALELEGSSGLFSGHLWLLKGYKKKKERKGGAAKRKRERKEEVELCCLALRRTARRHFVGFLHWVKNCGQRRIQAKILRCEIENCGNSWPIRHYDFFGIFSPHSGFHRIARRFPSFACFFFFLFYSANHFLFSWFYCVGIALYTKFCRREKEQESTWWGLFPVSEFK